MKKTLVLLVICLIQALIQTAHAASFEGTSKRYIAQHDIFRVLYQKFVYGVSAVSSDCQNITDANQQFLGTPSPLTGAPLFKGPSPGYVKWYSRCLLSFISADFTFAVNNGTALDTYLGGTDTQLATTPAPTWGTAVIPNAVQLSTIWSTLPLAAQQQIIRHQVHRFIGPGVVQNEDAFIEKMRASLKPFEDQDVSDVAQKLAFLICTQDEFLTY